MVNCEWLINLQTYYQLYPTENLYKVEKGNAENQFSAFPFLIKGEFKMRR
jgi:hypothetical protein